MGIYIIAAGAAVFQLWRQEETISRGSSCILFTDGDIR